MLVEIAANRCPPASGPSSWAGFASTSLLLVWWAREATVLAYQHLFLLVGVMILILLPLLFLLKVDRSAKVHGELEAE